MPIFENLLNNKKILVSVVICGFGLFLNFVGICIGQGQVKAPEGVTNPIGLYWYYLFFYIVTLGSVIGAVGTDSVQSYRVALCSLLAVTLSYVPSNISVFLSLSTVKQTGSSGGLAVAGLVFFILPLFPLLVWIGCEDDAPLNRGLDLKQLKLGSFFGESTATLGGRNSTEAVRV